MTTQLVTLTNALAQLGYDAGPPPQATEAARIDAQAWTAAECPSCGNVGLELRPFHRHASYKAVATCPLCGHTEEV